MMTPGTDAPTPINTIQAHFQPKGIYQAQRDA